MTKPNRSRYIIRSRSNDRVIFGTWFVPEYISGERGPGFRDRLTESCLVIAGPIVFKEYLGKVLEFFAKTARAQGCRPASKKSETKSKIRYAIAGVPTITWIYGLQGLAKKGFVLEKVDSFGRLLG